MKLLLISQVPVYYEQFRAKQAAFPDFQAQSFWLNALTQLGHQIDVFKYSECLFEQDVYSKRLALYVQKKYPKWFARYKRYRNKMYSIMPDNIVRSNKLVRLLKENYYQTVIFSGGISELSGKEFQYLREQNIASYLLHGVNPEQGATSYEKKYASYFTKIVVNDLRHQAGWEALGAKCVQALPYSGIDPEFHQDLGLSRDIDVVFVGTLFEERQDYFTQILNQVSQLQLYGFIPFHSQLDSRLASAYQGEAWGQAMVRLFNQAKIVINLLPDHMPTGGNMRTFEIPACGALQLANRCPQNWFVPGKEIVLFSSPSDLADKINYYLRHKAERKQIAKAGYVKTHKEYTYRKRFEELLK